MMNVPTTKPYFPPEDIEEILKGMEEILSSGRFIKGRFLSAFEEEFARFVGARYAIATSSGTAALELVYRYFDVKGKEVITPTNTFIATSNAVLFAGGRPVLADMDADTLCLDVADVEKRVTPQTCGVVLVHMVGFITPQIEKIRSLCKERNLFFVEDASHAHGASYNGIKAGTWGDAAVFSCLATKVMTTGGVGGVITTNTENLALFARSLRFHGEDKTRGIQDRIGNNWMLSEPQALIGYVQTKRLSEIVEKRMAIAKRYDEVFGEISRLKIFSLPGGATCGYYKYPLLLQAPLVRSNIIKALEENGVATGGSYWPPCHLQPVYKKEFGYKEGDFPIAEDILSRVVTLPIYAGMTDEEIAYVIDAVKRSIVITNPR